VAENDVLVVNNLTMEIATAQSDGAVVRQLLVDNVSFRVGRGRIVGLIGESGAGKSTIGLAAMGYGRGPIKIKSGEVLLNGDAISWRDAGTRKSFRGSRVTYVAQSAAAAFNPSHRIGRQVIEASVRHGIMNREAARKEAVRLFELLGLPDPNRFGSKYPHQVSGGQLQRAMTAMALCSKPELIIFDEPTTALDVTTQLGVLAAIKAAVRETNTSGIYITHDLAVVAQIADEIVVLRRGRLIEQGPADRIVAEPREPYTRSLVAARNVSLDPRERHGTPILQLNSVGARFGSIPVLDEVSLVLQRQHTLAIVGESGSGKTTLGRVITGLVPPVTGEIHFDGVPLPPRRSGRALELLRRIQMIHQSPDTALNPRQTVRDIVGRPLTLYDGMRGREKSDRVAELLEQIEMGSQYLHRYPAELSGGQKQRVSIARALAARPEVIVCDEPTSALDPLVGVEILKLLRRLQDETGVSYLFITHDLEIVGAIADQVAVMYRGRIVRLGDRRTVLTPPYDDYTQTLLNSVPEMRVGWLEAALAARATRENASMLAIKDSGNS
jgi:peptide/nickel transport system ATP-binding protein